MPIGGILGGLIGAGGSIFGASNSASAAEDAAKTQADAAVQAAQIQEGMFNTIQGNMLPFLRGGWNASEGLSNILGFGPDGSFQWSTANNPTGYTTNSPLLNTPFSTLGAAPTLPTLPTYNGPTPPTLPSYNNTTPTSMPAPTMGQLQPYMAPLDFQLQQGANAIANSGVGRTGAMSGNTLKALQAYASGLTQQNFQQAYQNYANNWQQGYQNQATNYQNTFAGNTQNMQQQYLNQAANYQNQFAGNTQNILDTYNAGNQNYWSTYNAANQSNNQLVNYLEYLAGAGQSAGANLGAAGVATAGNQGNALIGAGNAQAAGIVGSANAFSGGLNSLSTQLQSPSFTNALNSLFGGGSSNNSTANNSSFLSSLFGGSNSPYNAYYAPTNQYFDASGNTFGGAGY